MLVSEIKKKKKKNVGVVLLLSADTVVGGRLCGSSCPLLLLAMRTRRYTIKPVTSPSINVVFSRNCRLNVSHVRLKALNN